MLAENYTGVKNFKFWDDFFSQCMYNVVETGKGFVTCHWCHSSLLGRMTFSQVLWDSAKTGDSIQWGMVYQATESMQANWCISTDFCTNLQPCTCQRKGYILLIAKPHCYFPPHTHTRVFSAKWKNIYNPNILLQMNLLRGPAEDHAFWSLKSQ